MNVYLFVCNQGLSKCLCLSMSIHPLKKYLSFCGSFQIHLQTHTYEVACNCVCINIVSMPKCTHSAYASWCVHRYTWRCGQKTWVESNYKTWMLKAGAHLSAWADNSWLFQLQTTIAFIKGTPEMQEWALSYCLIKRAQMHTQSYINSKEDEKQTLLIWNNWDNHFQEKMFHPLFIHHYCLAFQTKILEWIPYPCSRDGYLV